MRHEWDPGPPSEADQREPDAEQCTGDQTLMEGIRDGNRGSLGLLMQRYWSPLVDYASAVAESRDEAEDVVQDTFVQVWRRRTRWTGLGAVNAYLYRITRNLALNVRRSRQARSQREQRWGTELYRTGRTNSPDKEVDADALRSEVEAAIAALPPRRREIITLSRFHGLTHHEIAQTLGLSVQTVANHMSVALADLRKALAQHLQLG